MYITLISMKSGNTWTFKIYVLAVRKTCLNPVKGKLQSDVSIYGITSLFPSAWNSDCCLLCSLFWAYYSFYRIDLGNNVYIVSQDCRESECGISQPCLTRMNVCDVTREHGFGNEDFPLKECFHCILYSVAFIAFADKFRQWNL